MSKLRAHPIIGARDFYYSYIIYQEELKVARGAGYFQRLWDCFSVPRIRRANYGASTVMLAQQMCGINSECLLLCLLSSPNLTSCSHLILQFNYLHKRRLLSNSGSIRISRLWCYSGRLYDPNPVPYRHQRSPLLNFTGESVPLMRMNTTDHCLQTFPLMCIFLLAAGLSLLKKDGSQAERIGPVVL